MIYKQTKPHDFVVDNGTSNALSSN